MQTTREGLTLAKVSRFIALPFSPSRLNTFMQVKQFEEISIKQLLAQGLQGILIDADGTLAPHYAREFNISVIDHVRDMLKNGLKVAIYTNAFEDRFEAFQEMGVKIVSNVPAKPDPLGFQIAMTDFLHLDDPAKVCMIGDSYITDGGAIDAGMLFIHVQPIKGNEHFFHSTTRLFAYICAKIYFR
jgi:uncharacterized protein